MDEGQRNLLSGSKLLASFSERDLAERKRVLHEWKRYFGKKLIYIPNHETGIYFLRLAKYLFEVIILALRVRTDLIGFSWRGSRMKELVKITTLSWHLVSC